ncbi:MAG: ribonuclease PH [Bacteriovoracaceae bacterium]|nr:ribonuclease PH [Bacteriovoracaceae bacterium]
MSKIIRAATRPISIICPPDFATKTTVIATCGRTKVLITASVEEDVPPFLKGKEQGWVTAEYAMLPGSTSPRHARETTRISGRTHEIQRLIGRSLRAVVDLKKLGPRKITLDCDVLVADGGTRTTSITGAYVALVLAIRELLQAGIIAEDPILDQVAAISVGINQEGNIIADLNYVEDSTCGTDMNIVMNGRGEFIEVQGTAERGTFSTEQLQHLLSCAQQALQERFKLQRQVLTTQKA